MKFAAVLAAAASVAVASPLTKRAVTDTDILNYALTLEHLENAFYSEALGKYDAKAFTDAGFPAFARGRISQVGAHEASHVAVLSQALGSKATKPCTYKFPYNDVQGFVGLAGVLEGVGVSAYLGAAGFIQEKAYLTVAGSILTTESRHQAWIMSAALKAQPWSGAYDTPLGLNQIYTLAAAFITGCPDSNPALPVKAFPSLTVDKANAAPGTQVTYTFNSTSGATYYAAYYSGLNVKSAKLDGSKKATIPDGLQGTYYTVITTSSNATVTDANTVAGPLISVVNFDSYAKNP